MRAISAAELQARVAANVAGQVRASDVPDLERLERLLAYHVEAGELEHIDGHYRLTPLDWERYGGLDDRLDVREAA
jgi:hypothetical protein